MSDAPETTAGHALSERVLGYRSPGAIDGLDHGPRRSMEDVHRTVPIPHGHWLRRLWAFTGPAYLVSVGYMDPGNWATDLDGGARFGYHLLWVLLMSNAMAV